ncbi:hypothetical protein GBAR_LOCUS28710, partial [Geodia barretti]
LITLSCHADLSSVWRKPLRNSLWRHTLQGDACVTNCCMPRTLSGVDIATHLYDTYISPLHKCHWYTSVSDRFTQ